MWKAKFCAVVFLLLVFVPDADCWRRRRRRRYSPPCSPHDCQVSSWSEWSPCTHQCGTSGKQTRTRTITVVSSCGGSCPFVLIQTRSCNRVNCQNFGTPTAVLATSTLQPRNSSFTLTTTQTPSKPVSTPSPFNETRRSSFQPLPSSQAVIISPSLTIPAVNSQPLSVVTVTSTIAPTPLSSGFVVTSASTIQVTTQPPFIACGGTLSGSSGSFASPGYPGFYSNNLNCSWSLFIPANAILRLQFIVFETEPFFDFVLLSDSFDQIIYKFSGIVVPGYTVTVRGERTTLLGIRFTTDYSVTRQGFKAQYSITLAPISSFVPAPSSSAIIATPTPTMQVTTKPPSTGECGEDLAGTSGFLTSPNFPNNFPRNTFCSSTITVPAGFIIKLTFLNFTLGPNEQTNCRGSLGEARVFIANVASDNGAQVITLCGQSNPSPVYSAGNFIQVRLLSLRNVFSGFKAFYEAIFSGGLNPSASILPPVASSSVATLVTLPPDVQRALVDLLLSLVQIIQRLQGLVGGSFSPVEFEDFRNQTLQILQQAENQLVNPSSSRLRNVRFIRREIQELSNPHDLVQMLENIQRRLLG